MKLKEWAETQGVSYITAYRWFKAGTFPVPAYQTESGTIIVEEDSTEPAMKQVPEEKISDSPVSQLIKKAFEMSKNGEPVEDLATFVISNFKLEKHGAEPEPVRKNRAKPTKEMTEGHFKKFLKINQVKPEAQMFLVDEFNFDKVVDASEKASAIDSGLKMEFTGAQNLGTVIPTPLTHLSHTSVPQVQSIASAMNTAISQTNATPTSYLSVNASGTSYSGALAGGGTILNSTLSAANIVPSAASFSSLGEPYTSGQMFSYSTDEDTDSEEDIAIYNPVRYDEARSLVDLIMDESQKQNMLAVDKKAKEICKLGRETFDLMFAAAKNQGK